MAPDSLVAVVPAAAEDELRRYAPHVTVWPVDPDVLVLVGDTVVADAPGVPVVRVGPGGWPRAAEELRRIGSPRFLIEQHRSGALPRRREPGDHDERIAAEQRRIGVPVAAGPDWPEFAATGRSGMLLVNEMPIDPPVAFRDRIKTVDRLREALADPAVAVTAVTGEHGIGKTALLAELRRRLGTAGSPPAGFVYLSGHDYRPVTVGTVLGDLVRVVPDGETRRETRRALAEGRPWRQNLGRVLEALDRAAVVLVLDDLDALLGADGEFDDRELAGLLLELAGRSGHRVRPVVAALGVPEVLIRRLGDRVREVGLDRGLPEPYDLALLRDLGLAAASEQEVRDACDATGGRPRWMELFAGVLSGDRARDAGSLAQDLRRTPEPGRWMLRVILDGLDRTERRVVQALAVFGRPVEPEAVNQLLYDHVPGLLSGPILRGLARRHVIRQDGGRYYLVPRPDAELVRASIPGRGAFGLEALRLRAAGYFASIRLDVREPDDLWPRFSEIELRLLGGDPAAAFRVMNEIDEQYLEPWGQSQALIPWRERLRLTHPRDAARNLWHLTKAYLQQDDPVRADEQASRALETLRRLGDARNALTVSIELANVWLSDGDTARALDRYEKATAEAHRLGQRPTEAGATMNAGLCHVERGDPEAADRCFRAATTLLRAYPEKSHPQLRAELLLNRGWAAALLDRTGEALELMRQALRHAERVRVERLIGTCLNGMATAQVYEDPDAAVRTAERAVAVGTPSGDRVLITRSHVTLALAHHFGGRPVPARAAVSEAVGRRLGESAHRVGALAVAGLIALTGDDVAAARQYFVDAASMSRRRILRDQGNHQVYDARGLALTGLVLAGDEDRADDAVEAYERARTITRMPGILTRNRRLLDSFGPYGKGEALDRIREVALRAEPP